MKKPITFLPAPELQDFIASYSILQIPEGKVEPYFSPPLAMSGLIINVGNSKGVAEPKVKNEDFFTDNAVVFGQFTAPVYGELIGEIKSIIIFFKPSGMHRLFKNDLSELTNTYRPLTQFLGDNEAGLLYNNLTAHTDNQKQINILNDFFRHRILSGEKDEKFEKVLVYIHERRGDVNVKDMLDVSGYPRKSLERHFRKKVGLSPKVYAQIYRFKCLINFLKNNPGITWSQLANHTGYFDQSHMSRYVKEYLQVSPNSIVKLDMDFIDYLLSR